jgi:RNA 2',3'-cyclic 3'-phosphodiesterase
MVRGKHVLYFALQPPPEAAAQALARLEALRAASRLTAKPWAPGRLHVSLNSIGDFKRPPGPVIDKALEAAQTAMARPFVVEFNRLGTWPAGDPPRPLVLWGDEGVIGVSALYATINKALVKAGMAPRREIEITPHMTLAYDNTAVAEIFVEPVNWAVSEFVLIHAVHGEGRFDVVGRFPLNG